MKPLFASGLVLVIVAFAVLAVAVGPSALSTTCVTEYGVFNSSGTLQGTGTDYSALYSEFVSSGNYPGYYINPIGQSCSYSSSGTATATSVPASEGPFYIALQGAPTEMASPLSETQAASLENTDNPVLLLPTALPSTTTTQPTGVTDYYGNSLAFAPLISGSDLYVELTQYQYLPVATLTATETTTSVQIVTADGSTTSTTVTGTTTTTTTVTVSKQTTVTQKVTSVVSAGGSTSTETQTQTVTLDVPARGSGVQVGLFALGAVVLFIAMAFLLASARRKH